MSDLFRVYFDPAEIGPDGYPYAWNVPARNAWEADHSVLAIKDLVREQADHRCVRCGHPYRKGEHPLEEVIDPDGTVRHESWSPCDERCTHRQPFREVGGIPEKITFAPEVSPRDLILEDPERRFESLWRILTVHHLNGIKHDCRWWNLASLCQRCHLTIQAKVFMERPWDREHSAWFKPYAAGFYAWKYLGLELSREETMARLDELLAIEQIQEALF